MDKRKQILRVEDLHVSFRTYAGIIQAVRGVDFHLYAGETIALVGESGCGKTATIQTIMGLNNDLNGCVRTGKVLLEQDDLLRFSEEQMRTVQGNRMSLIFQDPFTFLNPTLTVGEQIAEVYRLHRGVTRQQAKERAIEILSLISMPAPAEQILRYPHQLSGGMRQRVMIAMALICEPMILFADEPTTALDVTIQAQIIELMKGLRERIDTSIVLITHDLGVVANMAERIYVMYAGRIVEHGYSRDVFHSPKHPYTVGLLGSVPRLDRRSEEGLASIPGAPPDLISPPTGCAFASRCRYTMKICVKAQPESKVFAQNDHYAACWRYHSACTIPQTEDRS